VHVFSTAYKNFCAIQVRQRETLLRHYQHVTIPNKLVSVAVLMDSVKETRYAML
jgi:hypothetical protein